MGLLTRYRIRHRAGAVFAAALLASGFPFHAGAQAAIASANGATVRKDPRPDSPSVTEVPASVELKLEWDKAEWIDLLKHSKTETRFFFGTTTTQQRQAKVWTLLPSQEVEGDLWLYVATPGRKKGWVRMSDVELAPGSDFTFPSEFPVLIPVRESEIPRLREGSLAEVLKRFSIGGGRLRLWLAVDPNGKVRAVGAIQSSLDPKLDRLMAQTVRKFRFDPVQLDGAPAFALLVLHFEFMTI